MNVLIFNYSHDLALASGRKNYYPPTRVRLMEHDLGPLAAFCADPGDQVLVSDDLVAPCESFYATMCPSVTFTSLSALSSSSSSFDFLPWGCDARADWLLQKAAGDRFRPTFSPAVLRLSSRQTACTLLSNTRKALSHLPLCGEARFCPSFAEAEAYVARHPHTILKAPLSGSGRGLRFASRSLSSPLSGWTKHTIRTQSGVAVEPFYERVLDFAAEFQALPNGRVVFQGISLFQTTSRCSYVNNIVAQQNVLRALLFEQCPEEVFQQVVHHLSSDLESIIQGQYHGPLGVDMMMVRQPDSKALLLHPCVEINLRHTMGMVALRLSSLLSEGLRGLFSVHYSSQSGRLFQQAAQWTKPEFASGRLLRGQLPLTPIMPDTQFAASLKIL